MVKRGGHGGRVGMQMAINKRKPETQNSVFRFCVYYNSTYSACGRRDVGTKDIIALRARPPGATWYYYRGISPRNYTVLNERNCAPYRHDTKTIRYRVPTTAEWKYISFYFIVVGHAIRPGRLLARRTFESGEISALARTVRKPFRGPNRPETRGQRTRPREHIGSLAPSDRFGPFENNA